MAKCKSSKASKPMAFGPASKNKSSKPAKSCKSGKC